MKKFIYRILLCVHLPTIAVSSFVAFWNLSYDWSDQSYLVHRMLTLLLLQVSLASIALIILLIIRERELKKITQADKKQ